MYRLNPWLLCALVPVLLSCGDDDAVPNLILPTERTIVESFEGTLTVNGAQTHPFSVNSGGILVSLADVTPDGSVIGLSLGTWDETTCHAVASNDEAVEGIRILRTATAAGNLCIRVYDTGQLTETITYRVVLEHL